MALANPSHELNRYCKQQQYISCLPLLPPAKSLRCSLSNNSKQSLAHQQHAQTHFQYDCLLAFPLIHQLGFKAGIIYCGYQGLPLDLLPLAVGSRTHLCLTLHGRNRGEIKF